MQKMLEN